MSTKIGTRLYSTTCAAELIVVRAPTGEVTLTCGGAPVVSDPATRPAVEADAGSGALLGKRYEDPDSGLEVLVTKGGSGALAVNGRGLVETAAKRLPASD